MGRPFPQPPQGCAGALSRVWLFWAGSSMQRCTAVVVNVCGRARILGHGPTYFLLASSSASSNVARVSAPSRGQCPAPARPLCRLHLCALPPGARSSSWKNRGTGGTHWQTDICGYIPRSWQSTLHTGSYPAEYSWNRAGTFHTVPSGMASAPRETTRRRCWTQ